MVLLVIFSSSVYTNRVIVSSEGANHGPSDGPSDATKKFFGDPGDEVSDDFETPEACKQSETVTTQTPTNSPELDALSGQLNALYAQDISQLSPEQSAKHQQEIADLQNKMNALQSQVVPPSPPEDYREPPDACKQAIVAMMKGQMKLIHDMIGTKLIPTLAKVSNVVAKVQSAITKAEAEGADPKKIAQIKGDIKTIEGNLATLKKFFDEMRIQIGKFLNASGAAAFDLMSKEAFDVGDQDAAAKAADKLVSAFSDLEEHVKELTKTTP